MLERSHETTLFAQQGEGHLPVFVALSTTGEAITTVTSVVEQGVSPDGETYFLKQGGLESLQIASLHAAGLPVPHVLQAVHEDRFATPFAGQTLSEHLTGDEDITGTLQAAGSLLRQIHEVLTVAPLSKGILATTYAHTAHSVDCFYYKSIGREAGIDIQDYAAHKRNVRTGEVPDRTISADPKVPSFIPNDRAFHPALAELVEVANTAARGYTNKLLPSVVDYRPHEDTEPAPYLVLPDKDVCYGDFKPENVLVDKAGRLTAIDPHLTLGSIYFDLAKFASRYIIEETSYGGRQELYAFYRGYGSMPAQEIPLYGPYTFADLIGVDMLNILKSYTRRYAQGDMSYRLTERLISPDFCNHLSKHIERLPGMRTSEQLDAFLYKR